jgi:hypothetical protein
MDNPIVKILRFLIFFPICFIAMAIVNWSLGHLLIWYLGLGKFWLIVVIVFLGGTIWVLFKMLASLLVMLAAYISPIKWLGTLTISILALINGGILGYNLWTLKEDYSGWETFGAVVATLLVLELTIALIFGAAAAAVSDENN